MSQDMTPTGFRVSRSPCPAIYKQNRGAVYELADECSLRTGENKQRPLPTTIAVLSVGIVSVAAFAFAVAASLLSSAPSAARAGFACLSSPCAHGVCVDQLNRQV
ncbi:hypothetical protein QTP88_020914 [Uroleucon formosanum]